MLVISTILMLAFLGDGGTLTLLAPGRRTCVGKHFTRESSCTKIIVNFVKNDDVIKNILETLNMVWEYPQVKSC